MTRLASEALVCMNIWERRFWNEPMDSIKIFASSSPEKTINGILRATPQIVAYCIRPIVSMTSGWYFKLWDVSQTIWVPNADKTLEQVIQYSSAVGCNPDQVSGVLEQLRTKIHNHLTIDWNYQDPRKWIDSACTIPLQHNRLDEDFVWFPFSS